MRGEEGGGVSKVGGKVHRAESKGYRRQYALSGKPEWRTPIQKIGDNVKHIDREHSLEADHMAKWGSGGGGTKGRQLGT